MKKRFLSVLLALCMILSLLPFSALAADIVGSGTCGDNDVTWTLDSEGTLTISGTGDMKDYSNLFSLPLAPWYSLRINIQSVVIADGVTSIGKWAFCECSNLTSVTIGNSVTSIGNWAFEDCTSLTSVTIGNSVTSIGDFAFTGCSNLMSVTIPASVTSIGREAFFDCTNLTDIAVDSNNPNYISINGIVFNKSCDNLVCYPAGKNGPYVVPNFVTSIGSGAFSTCCGLTDVTIPASVTSIGSRAFYVCTSLTSVTIPDSVTSIGDSAFEVCSHLTSVTIPDSVTSIEEYAFFGCNRLTDVYYGGSTEEWEAIFIRTANAPLTSATIHYYSTGPDDDPLADNHIISIDWGKLGEGQLNDWLTITITFDQALDSDAVASSNGFIQLWCKTEAGWRVIRNIANNYFIVNPDAPNELIIDIDNNISSVWNSELNAIPYDSELSLSITPDVVVFADSDVKFQGIAVEAVTIKTAWGLTPDTDFFSFSNSNTGTTGDGGFTCAHYTLSDTVAAYLLSLTTRNSSNYYKIQKNINEEEWNGSCLGMSSVMGLAKIDSLNLQAWDTDAQTCFELDAPKNSKDEFGTQDLINYYQLLQNLDSYPRVKAYKNVAVNWIQNQNSVTWVQVANKIIECARDFQDSKTPLIINMEFKCWNSNKNKKQNAAHTCLAYGYEENSDAYLLVLYDPSYPTADTILSIDKITYDATLIGWWHSDAGSSPCELTALGYTDISNLTQYNLDQYASLFTSAYLTDTSDEYAVIYFGINSDCTITNSAGEYISYQNGELSGTMNVYDLSTIGEGETASAEYKLCVEKSEKFTYYSTSGDANFTVSQDGNYLQAETEQDGVTISISPGETLELNGLQSADYKLFASIDSVDGDMVAIAGQSTDTVTAYYTERGQVQLTSSDILTTDVIIFDGASTEKSEVDFTQNGPVIATQIPTSGIVLTPSALSLASGSSTSLSVEVEPTNATNKTVAWSSSNPAVATVDSNGVVTAVLKGTAIITVTTADGGFTATCAVTVYDSTTLTVSQAYGDIYSATVRVDPEEASLSLTVMALTDTGADAVLRAYLAEYDDDGRLTGLSVLPCQVTEDGFLFSGEVPETAYKLFLLDGDWRPVTEAYVGKQF